MKRFFSISLSVLLFFTSALSAYAQSRDSITNRRLPKFSKEVDRMSSNKLYRMTYLGVPLIVGGFIVKSEDKHFRSLRNDYMPMFNRHFDDYMQFAPAAMMLGMKIGGVEGNSSWSRMLVSDAFSALIMASVVNTLKSTASVERPDGSNRHSFPSGHTATAFMTATMLNKEYGEKYPLVGIGGYAIASSTGLMRMANNKHWLSDVMTGAGIGILSTEFGYFINDLLFKDKGQKKEDDDEFDRLDKPSFIGLYLGMNIPLSNYDIDDKTVFRTSSGSSAGVEGAYFFNPYIGVGGRVVVANTSIIVNKTDAEDNTFDALTMYTGGYFSYPVSSRWNIGSKLLVGYVHYPKMELTEETVDGRNGIGFGSGLSLFFKAKQRYGMRFFLDYNLQPSHSKQSGEYMNTLVLGASMVLSL